MRLCPGRSSDVSLQPISQVNAKTRVECQHCIFHIYSYQPPIAQRCSNRSHLRSHSIIKSLEIRLGKALPISIRAKLWTNRVDSTVQYLKGDLNRRQPSIIWTPFRVSRPAKLRKTLRADTQQKTHNSSKAASTFCAINVQHDHSSHIRTKGSSHG